MKWFLVTLVGLLSTVMLSQPAYAQHSHPADTVNWKLLFNQLFALEIQKELPVDLNAQERHTALLQKLREHTHYTDSTFNQTIDKVLQGNTSNEAYNLRRKHY
jgi:uncharacterized protein YdiU (UPF0061 family)